MKYRVRISIVVGLCTVCFCVCGSSGYRRNDYLQTDQKTDPQRYDDPQTCKEMVNANQKKLAGVFAS